MGADDEERVAANYGRNYERLRQGQGASTTRTTCSTSTRTSPRPGDPRRVAPRGSGGRAGVRADAGPCLRAIVRSGRSGRRPDHRPHPLRERRAHRDRVWSAARGCGSSAPSDRSGPRCPAFPDVPRRGRDVRPLVDRHLAGCDQPPAPRHDRAGPGVVPGMPEGADRPEGGGDLGHRGARRHRCRRGGRGREDRCAAHDDGCRRARVRRQAVTVPTTRAATTERTALGTDDGPDGAITARLSRGRVSPTRWNSLRSE